MIELSNVSRIMPGFVVYAQNPDRKLSPVCQILSARESRSLSLSLAYKEFSEGILAIVFHI